MALQYSLPNELHQVENLNTSAAHFLVISDLHIARGKEPSGMIAGTENFFADDAFYRWIEFHLNKYQNEAATLVINGDFIDFLRVIFTEAEVLHFDYMEWQNILQKVHIQRTLEELKASFSEDEKVYGFKTDDFKCIWKLEKVMAGHQKVFLALTEWLSCPNKELLIIKGNHDLEWHWEKVQEYFSLKLNEIAVMHNRLILGKISFIQDAVIINKKLYIEHGHRYDKYAHVVGTPTLEGNLSGQLRLPLGSFINRYLLNRIEIAYPFLDNIRPTSNILAILLKERFPLAIEILTKRMLALLKFVDKKAFAYVFGQALTFIGIIMLPVALTIFLMYKDIMNINLKGDWGNLGFLKNLGTLVLSYIIGQFVGIFNLKEPDDLSQEAPRIFKKYPELEVITMGHTHNPMQIFHENKAFFNSGTWIPIVEQSVGNLKEDKTYNYLEINFLEEYLFSKDSLKRWNDDAQRPEGLYLTLKN
ncbi:MAG: hypothetical protein ACOVQ4_15160 [Flectobacillus sp.]|uniref:hypothetical protein n=1 Tax=Flectobacillus sp. TaxID=50419 RepID=UPI003B9B9FEA